MPTVGIIGAGTMGTGVAQVAAAAGWTVELMDLDPAVVQKAIDSIRKRFDRLVEQGRMTLAQRDAAAKRLLIATEGDCLCECELIVEAIVEDLKAKCDTLAGLRSHLRRDAIVATNTSSLSISRIGTGFGQPARLVGMHFFNPPALMPLVEVVAGQSSSAAAIDRVVEIATEWGKTAVRVADTPGFIVNRVARGYYLEPMRMLEEGVAGVDEIDSILRRFGGFRLGPFELMDLVGNDVSHAVSVSVWQGLDEAPRLRPSRAQMELVNRGDLGRKTKQGWYSYQPEHPVPAVMVDRKSFDVPDRIHQAVRLFCEKATDEDGSITEQYVFARALVTIINEAALALDQHVAGEDDINTAMKLGTNHPHGPFEWADRIGRRTCRFLLDALERQSGDRRFTAANSLRDTPG